MAMTVDPGTGSVGPLFHAFMLYLVLYSYLADPGCTSNRPLGKLHSFFFTLYHLEIISTYILDLEERSILVRIGHLFFMVNYCRQLSKLIIADTLFKQLFPEE